MHWISHEPNVFLLSSCDDDDGWCEKNESFRDNDGKSYNWDWSSRPSRRSSTAVEPAWSTFVTSSIDRITITRRNNVHLDWSEISSHCQYSWFTDSSEQICRQVKFSRSTIDSIARFSRSFRQHTPKTFSYDFCFDSMRLDNSNYASKSFAVLRIKTGSASIQVKNFSSRN